MLTAVFVIVGVPVAGASENQSCVPVGTDSESDAEKDVEPAAKVPGGVRVVDLASHRSPPYQ